MIALSLAAVAAVLVLVASFTLGGSAQASSQAGGTPTCVSDATVGGSPAWTSPGNAATSDNVYATASRDNLTSTQYIKCTGFGFSIPAGATINGIIATVERKVNTAGNAQDSEVKLVKGGAITATNRATTNGYTTSDVAEAHGTAADLWGSTWTDSDIKPAPSGSCSQRLSITSKPFLWTR